MNRSRASKIDTHRKGVLVVDDDDAIREALCELLQLDGFEVRMATNGKQALDVLRRGPKPDVVLLDLMMPVMDGWSFRAEQLRDPELAEVPVIVITAIGAGDQSPVDPGHTLTKPIEYQRLLDMIEEA